MMIPLLISAISFLISEIIEGEMLFMAWVTPSYLTVTAVGIGEKVVRDDQRPHKNIGVGVVLLKECVELGRGILLVEEEGEGEHDELVVLDGFAEQIKEDLDHVDSHDLLLQQNLSDR
jgi:hypothetical protein